MCKENIITRYLTILVIFFLLNSCTYNFRREKLVSDCFPPFDAESENYISLSHSFLTLWMFSETNPKYSYLKSKNIIGYIVPGRVTGHDKRISKGEKLHFTGEVVKQRPNFLEYHLGGSEKGALRVVIYNNERYLSMFKEEFSEEWYNSLPKKCRY